jgi:hypothetical protein
MLLGACSSGGSSGTPTQATGTGSATDAPASPSAANSVAGTPVPATYFGMHVGLLGVADVPVPEKAGSIRLWDSGVSWREIEPEKGKYNWAPLDTAVTKAEAMGAKDIMWVHGSPPQWAAKDPQAKGLYGPGTSSAPEEKAYLDTLAAVAERYKGRIRTFQVWNEANIKIFYRGTPQYLADLTAKSKDVLDKIDPDAVLVGASTTVRKNGPFKSFYTGYSDALKAKGWPVDVMAVHLYPLADQGPQTRDDYIRGIMSWLADRGWTGPVWDTEVNFGDRRDFAKKKVTVATEDAPAYLARTYLDGLALGLGRAYWYTWNDHLLGIDLVDPATGAVQPAGQAYLTLQDWLAGGTMQGCTGEITKPTGSQGAISTCQFVLADGRPGQITWTHKGTTAVAAPEGTTALCNLDGTCNTLTPGAAFEVGTEPVLLRLG